MPGALNQLVGSHQLIPATWTLNTNLWALVLFYARIKISVNTDISVIGFYGNIGNIGKYRWKFLQKYRFD